MSCYFNAQDYGTCPDGKTMNTGALQSAINACNDAGGGIVFCAAGVYLTGSLELKSNVELRLAPGCKIIGSADINDYDDFISDGFNSSAAPERTVKYLIGARGAANIAISGAGEINASGLSFYDKTKLRPNGKFAEKPAQRPRLLMLHKCTDVRIEGASFLDSPCWTFWLMMCERVHIRGIRILGNQKMINNDGIDIDACKDVTVSDCIITTDDDCIVLRAIQGMYDTPAICENVTVINCVLDSTCQGIRVGCPSDNIIRNCAFSNIVITARTGINIDNPKSYQSNDKVGLDLHNIVFSNFTINADGCPIRIYVEEGIARRAYSEGGTGLRCRPRKGMSRHRSVQRAGLRRR